MHEDELPGYLFWHRTPDNGGTTGKDFRVHEFAGGMAQKRGGDEEGSGEFGGQAQFHCHMCQARADFYITPTGILEGASQGGEGEGSGVSEEGSGVVENFPTTL